MANVQIFENVEFGKVRTILINNEPYFVGKDVAEVLGYVNPQKAIRDHVDEDDKTVNDSFTVNGTMGLLINESGVYALIFRSKLPKAKEFKHWVTSEVLPSIRKTGSYSVIEKSQIQIASEEMDYTVKLAKSLEEFGVESGIAKVHALKIGRNFYKAITDSTINDITALLPSIKTKDIATLTPTKIAEEINSKNLLDVEIKARSVNKALENLGYQTREGNSWKLTDKASDIAYMFPYENNYHVGYQIKWKHEVINILIEYFKDLY